MSSARKLRRGGEQVVEVAAMSVDAAEQLFHDWQCPDIAALYQLAASYRRTPGE